MSQPASSEDTSLPSRLPAAPKAKVLIVDDDERTTMAVWSALEQLGQTLVIANSGKEALHHLLHNDFAVILLDVNMPDMDGYEVAQYVRARKRTRHIPIVFLTALYRDDTHLLQAYSAGAVDMVFKPVDPLILRSKVQVFVDLYLKQAEISREAELRHRLQEENFRVRAEKLSTEQALRRSQEHQEEMARAEAHQRTLIEELNHRVKNMLTVVNAMARQTLASNPAPDVFADKFIRRIDALGRTHSLLSREQWGTVQLADIARDCLEHYMVEDKKRVALKGPAVALDPKAAVALGIVFYELATNAVKHGALSNIAGSVTVSWTAMDQAVSLQWEEQGGPDVSAPARAGFGSRLIKLELTHELNGSVDMIYDRTGLRVTMDFPLTGGSQAARLKQGMAE
jgi:two-component sensor histidine kinase/CheY-like chemotaxis protein